MTETISLTTVILIILGITLFVVPIFGDAYFQRKSRHYADELLEENVEEYNKQIKAGAITLLVRRSIWGLLFLAGVLWDFRAAFENFNWQILITISGWNDLFRICDIGLQARTKAA